jgi:hypothetical protein
MGLKGLRLSVEGTLIVGIVDRSRHTGNKSRVKGLCKHALERVPGVIYESDGSVANRYLGAKTVGMTVRARFASQSCYAPRGEETPRGVEWSQTLCAAAVTEQIITISILLRELQVERD